MAHKAHSFHKNWFKNISCVFYKIFKYLVGKCLRTHCTQQVIVPSLTSSLLIPVLTQDNVNMGSCLGCQVLVGTYHVSETVERYVVSFSKFLLLYWIKVVMLMYVMQRNAPAHLLLFSIYLWWKCVKMIINYQTYKCTV